MNASGFAARTLASRPRLVRTSPAPKRIDRSSSTCPGTRMQRRSAGMSGDRVAGRQIVLGDATFDEPLSEPLGAGEKVGGKIAVAQQAFEIAAAARIEIHPARIEHQRGRRQEIGAEPDRADEPVLDADQRYAGTRRPPRRALPAGARPSPRSRRCLLAAMRAGRLQRPRNRRGGTPARRPTSAENRRCAAASRTTSRRTPRCGGSWSRSGATRQAIASASSKPVAASRNGSRHRVATRQTPAKISSTERRKPRSGTRRCRQ